MNKVPALGAVSRSALRARCDMCCLPSDAAGRALVAKCGGLAVITLEIAVSVASGTQGIAWAFNGQHGGASASRDRGVSTRSAEELIAYCREHLSTVKCPRSVDFDPALPRLDNGKLYKRHIKDRYWHGHASRVAG